MKRILLIDDHPSIHRALKQLIADEVSEVEFGDGFNAADALRLIGEKPWNLLILDIDMPGRSGLEVLKQLKDEELKIPVLMFSMHSEEEAAMRALKMGAAGYLSKDVADAELMQAIRTILAGRKYITASLAEKLAARLEYPVNQPPQDLLSEREYSTFLLIAKGKTLSEIAEELCLATSTVSVYRARILDKMCMKNNAQLINYAVKNNLV